MTDVALKPINPPSFQPPKGYANGMLGEGRSLAVAGQIAWDSENRIVSDNLAEQFAQALDNVLAVVKAAGGKAEHIQEMTIFCTDLAAYRASQKEFGAAWRPRLGKHFPAMAMIGVSELVEPGAKIEIQARALLPLEKK